MNNSTNPLAKPFLSLCMIVKNEKENLPRCLASVKPYVDELIIVDTGSQDESREIALQYGAKVKHFEWCNDFSAARNYAISQASGEWILMLDADEELIVTSKSVIDTIHESILNQNIIAFLLEYQQASDHLNLTSFYRYSLFRNISELRYVGRFHELLKYRNQEISVDRRKRLDGIKILDYSLNKENQLQKNVNRNIPFLEEMRQTEGLSLRLLYGLAEMYRKDQQLEKCQECYVEAFERLQPNLRTGAKPEPFQFIPSILCALEMQFVAQKDYETAQLIIQRGLEWCPNFPPLNFITGLTLRDLGLTVEVIACLENCLRLGEEGSYYKGEPFDPKFMTLYPAYELGCTYMQQSLLPEALTAFEQALFFDPSFTAAQNKINEIRQLLEKIEQ